MMYPGSGSQMPDLVPEVLQPAADVDAEQLEHEPEDRQPDQPGDDLSDPPPPGRAELDRGRDCAWALTQEVSIRAAAAQILPSVVSVDHVR